MKAFDAYCNECDFSYVCWVPWGHEAGDTLGWSHSIDGIHMHYCGHKLLRECSGLSDHPKWGENK